MNFFSLFKRNIIYKFKKKILIDLDKVEEKSLDKLFQFYGSDKGNFFEAGNTRGHGYSDFYVSQLNNLKDNKINILEIGSYAGGSAAAFAKYFSKANIFCLDINLRNFISRANRPTSIHIYFNIYFFYILYKHDILFFNLNTIIIYMLNILYA